jgi:hypothetical protein
MERCFGAGPDSQRSNETNYLLLTNQAGASAGLRPVSTVLVGGGLDYIKPYVGSGSSDSIPTVSSLFDDSSAPGLSAADVSQVACIRRLRQSPSAQSQEGRAVSRRLQPLRRPRRSRYTFNRIDVDAQHAVSFLRSGASSSDEQC